MSDNPVYGDLIRLGPWCGRVVDILTSETTGERFARVQLLKHQPGVTEVHPVSALKSATLADAQLELDALQNRVDAARELLGVE